MTTLLAPSPPQPDPLTNREGAPGTFDWRRCWYPVSLVQDLPDGPLGFSIYDLSLVLFRSTGGRLSCLPDRCPHRAARLSDGRVTDQGLECLYHGWQFGEDGRCVHIPQLPGRAPIPDRAHLRSYPVAERQGIVWIWPGEPASAAEDAIPTIPALDRSGVRSIDFMIDLPYAQSYLIENVVDLAHIHIAHDGIRGGGRRELAKPLVFRAMDNSVAGIRGTFESAESESTSAPSPLRAARISFVAPNLVWYETDYHRSDLTSGLALYSIPTGTRRCRLIYRAYSNFWPWTDRIRPRAVQHWTQCTILEQDMAVVIGQAEEIEKAGVKLRDLWLPLKTSDSLVILYRKWLDAHGSSLPFYRGFASARDHEAAGHAADCRPEAIDRASLHTRICRSCSRAHRTAVRLTQGLIGAAFVLLAAGIMTAGSAASGVTVAAALAAGLGAVAAHTVKVRFE